MNRIILNNVVILKEAIEAENEEVTYYSFLSHLKAFLANLLTDPINAKPDTFLLAHELNKGKLLNLLLNRGIIERESDVVDNDVKENEQPTFKIKYKIPRKNFERKIKRLYSKLFEINLPPKIEKLEEDGEGGMLGGATSASAVNDTAPIAPLGQVQRRKIYLTNEQLDKIEESTTTSSAGDYQYSVPFMFKPEGGGKDEAYIHRKPGGISVDRIK